jgi:hypothetical protein
VVISGLEQIQNSGRAEAMNLVAQRQKVAEMSFWNAMSTAVYSDGTAFGGKQMGGLALLVSKTPTVGVVGGIDSAANTWWRNTANDQTTDPLSTITALNIQGYFNKITPNLKRNSDGVDLIVADTNITASLRHSRPFSASFQRLASWCWLHLLKYYGAGKEVDVILDGGKGGQIPASTRTSSTLSSSTIARRVSGTSK